MRILAIPRVGMLLHLFLRQIVEGDATANAPKTTQNSRNKLAKAFNTVVQDKVLAPQVERLLAIPAASVNDTDTYTIIHPLIAQHVSNTMEAVHGFISDEAPMARGDNVRNLPSGFSGVNGRSCIAHGQPNTARREVRSSPRKRRRMAKLEIEVKDASDFFTSIRKKWPPNKPFLLPQALKKPCLNPT